MGIDAAEGREKPIITPTRARDERAKLARAKAEAVGQAVLLIGIARKPARIDTDTCQCMQP